MLTIEIDGTGVTNFDPCLTINVGNSDVLVMAVQGLVINRCKNSAISISDGADGALVWGNFIGTDPTGTFRPDPDLFTNVGCRIFADFVLIGGADALRAQLIAGWDGSAVAATSAVGTWVEGNLVGTNAAGDGTIFVLPAPRPPA